MTYWCNHCECEVKNPRYVKVEMIHYEVDTRQTEEWETAVCPCCGEEVDEASTCEVCGDPTPNGTHICDFCYDVMVCEYKSMIDKIAERLHLTKEKAEEHFGDWLAEQE